MLGKISKVRHAAVLAAVGGTSVLAATGTIGEGSYPERFDQWQSVIQPAGDNGLRIVDTFDQDFGSEERRGPETYIAHTFGAPIDIEASSPDAPDTLTVDDFTTETRVRIGDADTFISGQHRYTLGYTLPNAFLDEGVLSLNVLDPDPKPIDSLEIIITGMILDDPTCFFGGFDAETPCEFVEARDGYYRALIEPLGSGEGVTVEGDITGYTDSIAVPLPPLPDRRESQRGLLALAVGGLGALGGAGTYRWARRKGRNEVFAGGAVDAAYGKLPPPGANAAAAPPVNLVSDDDMSDLATTEFVPPKGIAPWEAGVLLTERLGDDAVESWLSGLAGMEAIEISEKGDKLVIAGGPKRGKLEPEDARLLDGILNIKDPYTTGKYDQRFAVAWNQIRTSQKQQIAASGWWKHFPPGGTVALKSGASLFPFLMFGVFALVWSGAALTAFLGVFSSWPLALGIGLVFPAVVGYFAYRALLPARSAQGSSLALQAESFRRFLHASEGHHVEWAWSKGVLREYSGWAVALGEADAWSKALDGANVPAPARAAAGPIIVHRRGPSMRNTRTAPAPKGGGGGGSRGGFSGGGSRGGRVGGGGGGRSRGSW